MEHPQTIDPEVQKNVACLLHALETDDGLRLRVREDPWQVLREFGFSLPDGVEREASELLAAARRNPAEPVQLVERLRTGLELAEVPTSLQAGLRPAVEAALNRREITDAELEKVVGGMESSSFLYDALGGACIAAGAINCALGDIPGGALGFTLGVGLIAHG